jgi:peptide/nickel transport system substrate-binding protein
LPLKGKRDIEKAKALIKEAGYKGERIVLITATDQPIVNAQAQVVTEELRQLGLNVDLQAMDWGTLINRRTVGALLKTPSTKTAGASFSPGSSARTW